MEKEYFIHLVLKNGDTIVISSEDFHIISEKEDGDVITVKPVDIFRHGLPVRTHTTPIKVQFSESSLSHIEFYENESEE